MLRHVQRQTAVTAHLKSEQLLLFAFELQDSLLSSSTGILTAVQFAFACCKKTIGVDYKIIIILPCGGKWQ